MMVILNDGLIWFAIKIKWTWKKAHLIYYRFICFLFFTWWRSANSWMMKPFPHFWHGKRVNALGSPGSGPVCRISLCLRSKFSGGTWFCKMKISRIIRYLKNEKATNYLYKVIPVQFNDLVGKDWGFFASFRVHSDPPWRARLDTQPREKLGPVFHDRFAKLLVFSLFSGVRVVGLRVGLKRKKIVAKVLTLLVRESNFYLRLALLIRARF